MSKRLTIVLAHGIFGWGDTAHEGPKPPQAYYYGLQPFLKQEYGSRADFELDISAPTVAYSDTVAGRGAQLKQAIVSVLAQAPDGTRAHIIAHSMAGLDARWMITQNGMADRIASLTTIATPHRGTTLGNIAYRLRGLIPHWRTGLDQIAGLRQKATALLTAIGLVDPALATKDQLGALHLLLKNVIENSTPEQVERGLHALTLQGCQEFNDSLAQQERDIRERNPKPVRYFAYGGRLGQEHIHLLKFSHDLLAQWGTPDEKQTGNDGAVSVWSSHYPWDDKPHEDRTDYSQGTVPFDHFMQINWRIPDRRPSDAMEPALQDVYRDIMKSILEVHTGQQ